jgi:DNA-binding transcriptional MerR regulator
MLMTTATRPATFTSAEVCRQTGLSYRQLDSWNRMGYFAPLNDEPGTGHNRVWPQAELDVARMMARLVALGVTTQQAAKVARDPQQQWRWLARVTNALEGWP